MISPYKPAAKPAEAGSLADTDTSTRPARTASDRSQMALSPALKQKAAAELQAGLENYSKIKTNLAYERARKTSDKIGAGISAFFSSKSTKTEDLIRLAHGKQTALGQWLQAKQDELIARKGMKPEDHSSLENMRHAVTIEAIKEIQSELASGFKIETRMAADCIETFNKVNKLISSGLYEAQFTTGTGAEDLRNARKELREIFSDRGINLHSKSWETTYSLPQFLTTTASITKDEWEVLKKFINYDDMTSVEFGQIQKILSRFPGVSSE